MSQSSPLQLTPAEGGLAALTLHSSGGSSAKIYAYGAHLASWQVAGKGEQLFMSKQAVFAEGQAIRGGVPVIFPQFGAFGPGRKHGFARTSMWHWNSSLSATNRAVFELKSSPQTLAAWPFAFAARLCLTLSDRELSIALTITNTDIQAFEFTSALHSYFAVAELQQTAVTGLEGLSYWDNGTPFSERYRDTQPELLIADALDRVYFKATHPLQLRQPQQTLHIESSGFADTVVWNPGRAGAAALADLDDQEFEKMLCIEAAIVEQPKVLQPEQSWTGVQLLRIG